MSTKAPVLFIHGLWLHATSWNPWMEKFGEASKAASGMFFTAAISVVTGGISLLTVPVMLSLLRRGGGRGCLHLPARHLWRVLLGRLRRVVDGRFRRVFSLYLHRCCGIDESFEHVFIAGRHAGLCQGGAR